MEVTMAGRFGFASMTCAFLLGGCGAVDTQPTPQQTLATVTVPASAETIPVATQRADAADDPAIFARVDGAPFRFAGAGVPGVLLGTDKKDGLYVRPEESRVGKECVSTGRSRGGP